MLSEYGLLLGGTIGEVTGLDASGMPHWAQTVLNEPFAALIAGAAFALIVLRLIFKR